MLSSMFVGSSTVSESDVVAQLSRLSRNCLNLMSLPSCCRCSLGGLPRGHRDVEPTELSDSESGVLAQSLLLLLPPQWPASLGATGALLWWLLWSWSWLGGGGRRQWPLAVATHLPRSFWGLLLLSLWGCCCCYGCCYYYCYCYD